MSRRSAGGGIGHLARRWAGSLSRRAPSAADLAWVSEQMTPAEASLWAAMPVADRRHSIEVARRFVMVRPTATTAETAGALLHDVGKVAAGLGTFGRVVATVVGPRTERFRTYRDHEALGAAAAASAGSSRETVELIAGLGPAAADLQHADDSI